MADKRAILVIGGGIAGTTAAVEAAEAGCEVHLVEKSPFLGGRASRIARYFPKLCPPACGLEIDYRRIWRSPRIHVQTLTVLEALEGGPGAYTATLRTAPRFVTDRCTACGECVEACPVEREDEFDYGLRKTKAIFAPRSGAWPPVYAIDGAACTGAACAKCASACTYGAIDLDMEPTTLTVEVGGIVVATGFRPYDKTRLEALGGGRLADVVTNVEMERLAAPDGPTGGAILRPSDGKPPSSVAFVQCAGSRDENHLAYCSGVCCLATLKQAMTVREKLPDARASIFFIDLRAPGRNEDVLARAQRDDRISFVRGKVASIARAPGGGLAVAVEDTAAGARVDDTFDLIVLATGMEPEARSGALPARVEIDQDGFVRSSAGVVAAGCARGPCDVAGAVRQATAAAARAMQAGTGSR